MGIRSSLSALLVTTALGGPARFSLSVTSAVTKLGGPIRISAQYLNIVQSYDRAILMTLVDSSSVIFDGYSFDVTIAAQQAPEINPYKPIVPDEIRDKLGPDVYAYFEENQETLRAQHNLIQAGDTTFPYQMIVTSHTTQQFRLGAVGRFYHADYGIIEARYVQFSDMVPVETAQCPVGLFRTKDSLRWVVTNDYAKSHPDLVVGIGAPWTLPDNGTYGWVIVDGPILQQVRNESTTFEIGESFAWSSSGSVSNTAAGKVIGRRVGKTDITRLPAGSMWVRTESFSEAEINAIITKSTQSLLASLLQLEREINALPSATALKTLQISVNTLKTTLQNEASNRIASDLRLNERISNLNFVTVDELDAAVKHATSTLESDLANLEVKVDFIRDNLNTLSAEVDILNGVEARVQTQLDAILALIMQIKSQPRNKFPVVDGSVPPNLVYLPDGSLVFTEE